MTGIEADIRGIRESIRVLDDLRAERETRAMMKLSEQSLSAFLEEELDLYTIGDVRIINSP